MRKLYKSLMLAMVMLFTVQAYSFSILLVNDNDYALDRVEVIKTAITNAGYEYTFFDAAVQGVAPSLELMNSHDLVVWYTGNDGGSLYFWNGDETDNESIKAYLDAGGMLWLQGLDFLYDRYPSVPTLFTEGDFVFDYLGISEYHAQSHVDDGFYSDGVPQFDLVEGNGIFTLNPMLWQYETMWYADAVLAKDGANGVYKMGPEGYDFDAYYGCVYNERGDAKILTLNTETARLDSQENTDELFAQGLGYFEQFEGAGVLSTLLVNDNGYAPERVEVIKTALANSGYDYIYFDAATEGASPSLETMSEYDLVIWYTGNDGAGLYFWNGDETVNESIKSYIDQGGMLWVQGLDFLYDKYSSTPVVFAEGDFVYDYMGIAEYHAQSKADDEGVGVPQFDLVEGNGIFELNPMTWAYSTMWYADALVATDNATAIYSMGPSDYVFSSYFGSIYNEVGDGKVLSISTETAKLDTQENTDLYILQGMDYFSQWGTGSGNVNVEEIIVTAEGGATEITEDGGSLQMYAEVLPENATVSSVSWSIVRGTGDATITNDGLLEGTGSSIGNGTVWAKATAADGSGVVDSLEITITNQGANSGGFEILLVNDNANGTERYLEIDTILMNLGYTYDVYSAVDEGVAPTAERLSYYQLVIWYTGNDGADLYLWDTSDTLDYKFNADLKEYVDNGGNVWLQGLDFMYDVLDQAPDYFEAGQFIYDYMGIQSYAVQSKRDLDELGMPEMDVVADNGVCEITPMSWVWETIWYADGFEITNNASPIYNMGPSDYVYSQYYCGLENIHEESHIMTFSVETAKFDTRENATTLFSEVLEYFKGLLSVNEHPHNEVVVSNIYPNPTSGDATLSYELKGQSSVSFKLMSITGQTIFAQNIGEQQIGRHEIKLSADALGLSNGVYFYSLIINENTVSGKMIINK